MEQSINISLGSLSEENAKEICRWKYKPPYDVYNWWSWDKLIQLNEPITDPIKRQKDFLGVFTSDNKFIGFAVFSNPTKGVTRLGLGLKPNMCGKGLGKALMSLILEEVKKRYPDNKIDLEVLTWNKRAYKTYLESGFEVVETYERKTPTGKAEFHRMVYKE